MVTTVWATHPIYTDCSYEVMQQSLERDTLLDARLVEEKTRSKCLCCILLSLLTVGICVIIAYASHPAVKYDVLAGRPPRVAASYTLETQDFALVNLVQHDPHYLHTEIAWRRNTVAYTYWHTSQVLVLQSGPLKGNCYHMPPTKAVYEGPVLVRRATAKVRAQPTTAYIPEALRSYAGHCGHEVTPVADRADHPGLSSVTEEPWGSSFDLASPSHVLALRAELDRVSSLALHEEALDVFRTELQSLWFNVSDSTLVRTSESHDWPLTEVGTAPQWSCAKIRGQVSPAVFDLCLDLVRCHETRVVTPAQGPVNTSTECRFTNTGYDCSCLRDFVAASASSALNGCGVCTVDHAANCRCWAEARFLSLVARLTPCVHVSESDSHTLYSGMPRVHSHCGQRSVRWGGMGVRRVNTVLSLCATELRGPVYTCHSMAEYLVRDTLPWSHL